MTCWGLLMPLQVGQCRTWCRWEGTDSLAGLSQGLGDLHANELTGYLKMDVKTKYLTITLISFSVFVFSDLHLFCRTFCSPNSRADGADRAFCCLPLAPDQTPSYEEMPIDC